MYDKNISFKCLKIRISVHRSSRVLYFFKAIHFWHSNATSSKVRYRN